jgi:hypothetical protein
MYDHIGLKDYGPNYYAAFLLDPDGNNVERSACARPGMALATS